MAKPKIDRDIKQATHAIKDLMQKNLALIADDIVKKIMINYRRLTDANKLTATKNINPTGVQAYKREMLNYMAVISADSIKQARTEVPKAKRIKLEEKLDSIQLGEFESLPAAIRKRLTASANLLIDTQLSDLEKAIYFQYASSHPATDSATLIESEISDKAYGYIDGASVYSGASVVAGNVINEARNAFFFDDKVLEQIVAFEFVNGDPVSPICISLAGTIFAKDDPNISTFQPPLHFNCKSYIVPILELKNGMKIEKLTPGPVSGYTNQQIMDSVQFSEKVKTCSCFSSHILNY